MGDFVRAMDQWHDEVKQTLNLSSDKEKGRGGAGRHPRVSTRRIPNMQNASPNKMPGKSMTNNGASISAVSRTLSGPINPASIIARRAADPGLRAMIGTTAAP